MDVDQADSYFVRFDASGDVAAAVPFPKDASGRVALERLVRGTTGQLYAGGWCSGPSSHFDLDCPQTGAGVLVALDDDGAVLWARALEGEGEPMTGGLAASDDGGVSPRQFGAAVVDARRGLPAGAPRRAGRRRRGARRPRRAGLDRRHRRAVRDAVVFAPDGSIVVKGWFEGAIALGPTTHEDGDPNGRSVFVARLVID